MDGRIEMIESDDFVLSIEEYMKHIEEGALMNCDGHGAWAKPPHKLAYDPNTAVLPSQGICCKPEWATHVVWYNR